MAQHNPGATPLVISRDSSLATLAAAYRRYIALQESSFPGDDSPERISFLELIARGAPIEIDGMQLVTISTAAIPSARFRVPAEPMAAALVRQQAKAVRAARISTLPPTPEEMQRERDRFIKRAVWASGRLWLLTERGTLSSIAPGERGRRAEPTPAPVAEICVARASRYFSAQTAKCRGSTAARGARPSTSHWAGSRSGRSVARTSVWSW